MTTKGDRRAERDKAVILLVVAAAWAEYNRAMAPARAEYDKEVER